MAQRFGLASAEEAFRYLAHPLLGPRLRECVHLLLALRTDDIQTVLDHPDDLKLRSCLTLFAAASPDEPLFQRALDKYFGGEPDPLTLGLLLPKGSACSRRSPTTVIPICSKLNKSPS